MASCCVDPRITHIVAKCSDLCRVELPDGEELDGYVPSNLGIGGGDYVNFKFCLGCGRIVGSFPIDEERVLP